MPRTVRADRVEELEAVHLRHHQVEQHDGGTMLAHPLDGDASVLRLVHRPVRATERAHHQGARRTVVLDDEDALAGAARADALERREQAGAVDRLRQVFRGAECDAEPRLVEDRRHHDRDPGERGIGLERGEHGPSVHAGHDRVERDHVGREGARTRETGPSVGCLLDSVARAREVIAHQGAGRCVVIDHEDRQSIPLLGRLRGGVHRHLGPRFRPRQAHRECGPLARHALDDDLAPHPLRDTPTDREPEPGAAVASCRRRVGLCEGLEEPRHLLRRHPDPRVRHAEHESVARRAALAAGRECDDAALGELAGVREQVEEHLPHAREVRVHRADLLVDLDDQSIVILLDERANGRRRGLDDLADRERLRGELHLPGLDLREIEHVVDQREQVLARGLDLRQVANERLESDLLLRLLLQHLAVADDRVERCAQLVAHVGKELALGAIRALGLVPRLGQLTDIVIHPHQRDARFVGNDRHAEDLDIHEGTVLPPSLSDPLHGPVGGVAAVLRGLAERARVRDEFVEVAAAGLLLGIEEELLERGVARGDLVVRVELDDRDGTVVEQTAEELALARRLLVEARALDGDRGLRGEEVEEPQVVRPECARRVRVHDRDRADEAIVDEQWCGDDGPHRHVAVLRRAAKPGVIVGDDERFARLRDESHRALAELQPDPGRILADLVARRHDKLAPDGVEDGELATGDPEQRDGARKRRLQRPRQLALREQVGHRAEHRLHLVGAPALRDDQPRPRDRDARLVGCRGQDLEVARAERLGFGALDREHADHVAVDDERHIHF